jgi:hypothetical protein
VGWASGPSAPRYSFSLECRQPPLRDQKSSSPRLRSDFGPFCTERHRISIGLVKFILYGKPSFHNCKLFPLLLVEIIFWIDSVQRLSYLIPYITTSKCVHNRDILSHLSQKEGQGREKTFSSFRLNQEGYAAHS